MLHVTWKNKTSWNNHLPGITDRLAEVCLCFVHQMWSGYKLHPGFTVNSLQEIGGNSLSTCCWTDAKASLILDTNPSPAWKILLADHFTLPIYWDSIKCGWSQINTTPKNNKTADLICDCECGQVEQIADTIWIWWLQTVLLTLTCQSVQLCRPYCTF